MKKNILYLFIIFQIVASSSLLLAQVNDAGMWLTISAEKKINKKFKVAVIEELRIRDNYSMIGTIFTDVSLEYKISKSFLVSGSYRFIARQNLDLYYEARQRFYADLVYKWKLKKFDFAIRTRIQDQDRFSREPEGVNRQTLYWRNKISVKYDYKKFTPFVGFEVYYPLNKIGGNVVDGFRYSLGTDYKINKKNAVAAYYLIDQEIQVNNPQTSYIVGLEYNYSF